MPATRDGKTWRCQFYYEDWQGVRHKKNKRGFKTKAEAEEWERNFRQQQRKDLDINFENFVEIYFADVENRLRESTIKNKRYVFDLKVTPYFKKKKMCEIKTSDIRAWQNELIKQGYAPTYLKSINNQLAELFNYAVRYYDLNDNPCRKAGSIGKSKADDMEFWTKQEFKQFLPSMDKKPEARMAFMLLYWTGMRIGELLALTYEDIDLEKRIISISKSYQRLDGKDVITPPKTPKSNRKITIPPFLAEELKEYCSHLYGIMPNERMFRFTKSYMEHEIVRGIKETGVKRIRLHDLRHSHASLLVELGFQPLAIAERLRHEKIETTLNTYSHLYPNKQAELADRLELENEEKDILNNIDGLVYPHKWEYLNYLEEIRYRKASTLTLQQVKEPILTFLEFNEMMERESVMPVEVVGNVQDAVVVEEAEEIEETIGTEKNQAEELEVQDISILESTVEEVAVIEPVVERPLTIEERAKEISTVIRNNYGRYDNVPVKVKAELFKFSIDDLDADMKLHSLVLKELNVKMYSSELYDDYMSVVDATDKKPVEAQNVNYYNIEKRWNRSR